MIKTVGSGEIVIKHGTKYCTIRPLWVMFPSGLEGIRLEAEEQDFGTIYWNPKEKKWKIVEW